MQIDLIHSDRGNRDENDALCTYKSVLVYVTVVKWQRRSWRYLVNICQQRDSEHRIVAVPIFRLCETKCNIWTNSTRQGNGFEWGDGRCGWKRSLHVEGVRLSVHDAELCRGRRRSRQLPSHRQRSARELQRSRASNLLPSTRWVN